MTIYHIFGYTALAGLLLLIILRLLRKPQSLLIDFLKNWVGALYIFSGAVKAIDPLGTAYKMTDYFEALHWEFFTPYATEFAVTMIVFEIVLGIALIVGWKAKLSTVLSFLMILFFTFLTGYTYLNGYFNPLYFDQTAKAAAEAAGQKVSMLVAFDEANMKVTECGCFGDFLKLHPRVSFFKDCFLLLVTLFLMLRSTKIDAALPKRPTVTTAFVMLVTLASLLFCFRNYKWNEPIVDFRPYKIGNNIFMLTQTIKPPVVEFVFLYKNKSTGKVEEIATADLTKKDLSQYEYVDRKDKVIDPGIPAKIINFIVEDENQQDIAPSILTNENYTFFVDCPNLEKSDKEGWKKVNEWSKANNNQYDFFAVVHGTGDKEAFRKSIGADYPFYTGDETFLKTIMRGSPGVMLLKNGVVVNKWHWRQLPDWESMKKENLK